MLIFNYKNYTCFGEENYSLFSLHTYTHISKSGSSLYVLSYNLIFSLNKLWTSFHNHYINIILQTPLLVVAYIPLYGSSSGISVSNFCKCLQWTLLKLLCILISLNYIPKSWTGKSKGHLHLRFLLHFSQFRLYQTIYPPAARGLFLYFYPTVSIFTYCHPTTVSLIHFYWSFKT